MWSCSLCLCDGEQRQSKEIERVRLEVCSIIGCCKVTSWKTQITSGEHTDQIKLYCWTSVIAFLFDPRNVGSVVVVSFLWLWWQLILHTFRDLTLLLKFITDARGGKKNNESFVFLVHRLLQVPPVNPTVISVINPPVKISWMRQRIPPVSSMCYFLRWPLRGSPPATVCLEMCKCGGEAFGV